MNKLIIIIASLLITVPVAAMEFMGATMISEEKGDKKTVTTTLNFKRTFKISEKENDDFVLHVSKAVDFNKKMVAEDKIGEDNAIHVILNNLSQNLALHDNDLGKMIQSNKSILSELLSYDCYVNGQIMSFKDQIKIPLIEAHQVTAEYYLKEICSQYKIMTRRIYPVLYYDKVICAHNFDQWVYDEWVEGAIMKQDRIDFMKENADYLKVDEDKRQACIDKYVAMLLYQDIFAKQID